MAIQIKDGENGSPRIISQISWKKLNDTLLRGWREYDHSNRIGVWFISLVGCLNAFLRTSLVRDKKTCKTSHSSLRLQGQLIWTDSYDYINKISYSCQTLVLKKNMMSPKVISASTLIALIAALACTNFSTPNLLIFQHFLHSTSLTKRSKLLEQ